MPGLEAMLSVRNETKSWIPKEKKRKVAEATGEGDDAAESDEKKQKADEAEAKEKKKAEEPVVKPLDDDGDDELMSPGAARNRARKGRKRR